MNLIVMLFFEMERVGILVINLAIKVRVALEDTGIMCLEDIKG
jgi:hypothetical protein